MLVLTRRIGQSVIVGDEVVITVLEVRGDVVRLGVQAPRAVQVHREEVYRELQLANRESASGTEEALRTVAALLGPKSGRGSARTHGSPAHPHPSPHPSSPSPSPSPGIRPPAGKRSSSPGNRPLPAIPPAIPPAPQHRPAAPPGDAVSGEQQQ